MSDVNDRLAKLSPEQRRLLERRLRERGLDVVGGRRERGAGAASGAAEGAEPDAWRRRPARPLRFSLYFFSDDGSKETGAKYRLTLESARFADAHGFDAVWTPERHFQAFGGLYPNPSVLGAALAAVTSRVGIRAGSVARALPHPAWVTTAGSPETWERAGSIGANVLAALVGYSPEDLTDQIGRYRLSRGCAGFDPHAGIVTLVVHTYVGKDDAAVRELVREPMTHYLK